MKQQTSNSSYNIPSSRNKKIELINKLLNKQKDPEEKKPQAENRKD